LLSTYIANLVFSVFNFFITDNPYSAFHAGNAGELSGVYSNTFYFNVAGILVTSVILINFLNYRCEIKTARVPLILFVGRIVFGIINGGIFLYPITYIYDFLINILVLSLVINSSKNYDYKNEIKYIFIFSIITFFLGVLLALINPNIWGFLPFEFSRDARGEVTLAYVTGSIITLPSLLVSNYKIKKFTRFIIYLLLIIIVASTATRTALLQLIIPLFIFLVLSPRSKNKLFFITIFLLTIIYYFDLIYNYFIAFGSFGPDAIDLILNGRLELWNYYYNQFLNSPLFGCGANLINSKNYDSIAVSEIGLLRILAQDGIFIALIQVYIVICAAIQSIKSVKSNYSDEYNLFASYIVLSLIPFYIFQDYSRILNISDFIFWFFIYYQYIIFIRKKSHE